MTVLQGIREKIPSERIGYAKGCDIEGGSADGISEAVKLAKDADVAIVIVGESAAMSGEAASRSSLDLPGFQQQLVQAVAETGTPVAVVLMNGRPLSVSWIADHVPAVLETWFLGTACGRAVADVLFGDVNPGGKLPVSFPRSVGQVPVYYNHKNTGRPPAEGKYSSKYLDLPVTPLFPFGYGLSFTTFSYTDLEIKADSAGYTALVNVNVTVANTGDRPGDEVVQLYIQDVVGSITRPVKELKGFQRITLNPKEKRRVEFLLAPDVFGFYDEKMDFAAEPGLFKIWVGPNSVEGLEASYELTARSIISPGKPK
jgi:beta-glucosidase